MLASLFTNLNNKKYKDDVLIFPKNITHWLLLGFIAPSELFAQDVELATLPPPRKLTEPQAKLASTNYQRYCALCHGEDRQGHINDHAPSLRSKAYFNPVFRTLF